MLMLREFYRPFASHFAAVLVAVVEMWCAECAKNAPFAPIISFQCQVKFAKMKFIKSFMRDTAWLAAVRQNLMLLARFSVWLNDSLEIWNASQGKRKRASARCVLVSSRRKDWTNAKMAHKWNEWTTIKIRFASHVNALRYGCRAESNAKMCTSCLKMLRLIAPWVLTHYKIVHGTPFLVNIGMEWGFPMNEDGNVGQPKDESAYFGGILGFSKLLTLPYTFLPINAIKMPIKIDKFRLIFLEIQKLIRNEKNGT